MPDQIHISKKDKKYLHIALDRLASNYEEHGNDEHARHVRRLAGRIEQEEVTRDGIPLELKEQLQEQTVAALHSNDVERVRELYREAFDLAAKYEPDPVFALSDVAFQDCQEFKQQVNASLLNMVLIKLQRLTQRHKDPNDVFSDLQAFLSAGLEASSAGNSDLTWAQEDEDIAAHLAEMLESGALN